MSTVNTAPSVSVPFADLRAQYRAIQSEIDEAVLRTLARGQFILGEEVAAFEKEFAGYCGVRHAVGMNSGTSALHLALLAAGVGPGDEVITVPFTFVATVSAIGYAGARAVLVDIHSDTFNLDPSKLEAAITPRTKAILPVHLYGRPAEMDGILAIAARHNLPVIEDAAQAHGAEYKGRRAGSMGAMGTFSFYPGKNLGAYGEGGAVITNDAALARTLRLLRDWGADKPHHHLLKGYNYRMEGLQGAILRVKLRRLESWIEARRAHAREYRSLLGGLCPPEPPESVRHVYNVFTIRHPRRDALREFLSAQGIQTAVYYPHGIHQQPAHRDLGYPDGAFPHTERAAAEVLALPVFPELTSQQIQAVAGAIRAFDK
jgi:dTDP-4-amino-4,6-dideoxygalactose transaminase